MPIEIRELHIKAVIDSGQGEKKAGTPTGTITPRPTNSGEQNAEQMIDLCVEKVLEILKEKQER